eukprot:Tbor_TRINITY_DN4782_c0_g1::TRINITY_DN4782_c0_g1_i1::g.17003::m.17003
MLNYIFLSSSTLLVILTALLLAKGGPSYANADVTTISIHDYISIEANNTLGAPWVVRFLSPYSPATKAEDNNFREASRMIHPSIAMFGELTIGPSLEEQTFIDILGLRSFPVVRYIHSKMTKASGTRGPESGRPVPKAVEFPKAWKADAIAQQVLKYSPSRYYHPITYKAVPSIHYIFTLDEMSDLATSVLPPRTSNPPHSAFSAPFGTDPIGFLFFFDLMKRDSLSVHAELASLGAKYGPRAVICATEDEKIAKKFGLVTRFTGVAFHMSAFGDLGKKLPKRIPAIAFLGSNEKTTAGPLDAGDAHESIATAGTAASFIKPLAFPYANYTSLIRKELYNWHRDVLAYASKSPLRKIQHTAEMKEVLDDTTTVTILFILRESDQFFPNHIQTAVKFATFIRNPLLFFKPGEPSLSGKRNYATMWVDGEVHKDFSTLIRVPRVPSVCVILHLKDEKIAAKFYELPDDVKKERRSKGQSTDWPIPQDLIKFLTSEEFLKLTPPIEVFRRDDVRFNDAYVDETFSAQKAISNHQYLYFDRKQYYNNIVSENENTFIEELADGKIEVNPNHYTDKTTNAKGDDDEVTLTPKQKKRAEKKKKKLLQEIEKKRLAKEERMRKKDTVDAKRRQEEAKKTKEQVTKKEKKKIQQVKKVTTGVPIVKGDKGPSIDPSRPPKDYIKLKKFWKDNTNQMIKDYVKDIKGGGVRVGKGLKKEKSSE